MAISFEEWYRRPDFHSWTPQLVGVTSRGGLNKLMNERLSLGFESYCNHHPHMASNNNSSLLSKACR